MAIYMALYTGYCYVRGGPHSVHGALIFEAKNYREAKTRADKNLSDACVMDSVFRGSMSEGLKSANASLDPRESRLVSLTKLEDLLGVTGEGALVRAHKKQKAQLACPESYGN